MKMATLQRFSVLNKATKMPGPAGMALLALGLLCAAATAARAQDEGATENTIPSPFVTFVVPTANQGTLPWTMNANGDVAGVYVDPSDGNLIHSFVRSAAGVFSLFDVPGAAVPNGSGDPHGTVLFGIDAAGDAVGMFTKGTRVDHGFVRTKAGSFTTFDAPGAGTGRNQGTVPVAFDASGGTLGFYLDGNYLYHGFHRTATGVVTDINDPNAGTASSGGGNAGDSDQGTNPAAINASGTIVGRYRRQLRLPRLYPHRRGSVLLHRCHRRGHGLSRGHPVGIDDEGMSRDLSGDRICQSRLRAPAPQAQSPPSALLRPALSSPP